MYRRVSDRGVQATPRTRSGAFRAALVFAALAMVLLFALPLPARADQTVQNGAYVYQPWPCIFGWSELTRQDTTTASAPYGLYPASLGSVFVSCIPYPTTYETVPTNQLFILQFLYYLSPGSVKPLLCRMAGPFYNSNAPAHSLVVYGPYWGSEPCGAGLYRLDTVVSANGMVGGSLSSPYLWD